ncbi:type II secretion system protein [Planctomycetota bacterium]|nr:type II secretion system protein [Planctomycetota bacterium]QQE12584.1 type II secretion system protein [Planctomycetota bacterium]
MKHKIAGFTVIELLAAIAIAGLLMVAVMQVVGTLGRTAKLVESTADTGQTWARILTDQLKRDMAHVEKVEHKQGVLRFKTLGGYDPDALAWQYMPSTITYRMAERSGMKVLVREQSLLVDGDSGETFKQVVAAGVESWKVKLDGGKNEEQTANVNIELRVIGYEQPLVVAVDVAMEQVGGEV